MAGSGISKHSLSSHSSSVFQNNNTCSRSHLGYLSCLLWIYCFHSTGTWGDLINRIPSSLIVHVQTDILLPRFDSQSQGHLCNSGHLLNLCMSYFQWLLILIVVLTGLRNVYRLVSMMCIGGVYDGISIHNWIMKFLPNGFKIWCCYWEMVKTRRGGPLGSISCLGPFLYRFSL